MTKYMGLGIACLTLVLSGVTRAHDIKVDDGKYGKNDISCNDDHSKICTDFKNDLKDIKCDIKDIKCDEKSNSDCKDIKCDLKDLKCDLKDLKSDLKDIHCKIVCDVKHDYNLCNLYDIKDGGKNCHIVMDYCDHAPCECSHDPAAVPTPASSAMGGAGVVGIMLMGWLRSRRSVLA